MTGSRKAFGVIPVPKTFNYHHYRRLALGCGQREDKIDAETQLRVCSWNIFVQMHGDFFEKFTCLPCVYTANIWEYSFEFGSGGEESYSFFGQHYSPESIPCLLSSSGVDSSLSSTIVTDESCSGSGPHFSVWRNETGRMNWHKDCTLHIRNYWCNALSDQKLGIKVTLKRSVRKSQKGKIVDDKCLWWILG